MAGPTPVSALIHAATMVTAGVYLIARSAFLFSLAPVAQLTVALIGALTALFAATIGLKQWDIKKVLAYSTVSQLGYMFVGVGVGAYAAGVFHLVTHAFFKALLFLGSGSVIYAMHRAYHATHNHDDAQDMRNMGGLRRYMPVTFVLMWIATLAIAGIPIFAGFFSKDEILAGVFARAHGSTLAEVTWFGIPGATLLYADLRDGARGGAAHRDLHDADDAVHVPRSEPHRREGAVASRRGAVGDDGTARRCSGVLSFVRRLAQPAGRSSRSARRRCCITGSSRSSAPRRRAVTGRRRDAQRHDRARAHRRRGRDRRRLVS